MSPGGMRRVERARHRAVHAGTRRPISLRAKSARQLYPLQTGDSTATSDKNPHAPWCRTARRRAPVCGVSLLIAGRRPGVLRSAPVMIVRFNSFAPFCRCGCPV